MADLISLVQEKKRQKHFINLIPSENFTSQAVLDALGSPMQSTIPTTWFWRNSRADMLPQTNTQKATREQDTTAATSSSTHQKDYASKGLWRPSGWTTSNGE